jgi:hypothetical protein
MKAISLSAFVFTATVSGSVFAGLAIDGNLADWQINPGTWVSSLAGVHSTVEDSTGSGPYYLNPGYGGQDYDAEAMYAVIQSNKLFIALVTGHDPSTPNDPLNNVFSAGDFAISFGRNGTYDLGINVVNNFDGGVLGGVYSSPTWAYGIWPDPDNPDTDHPTSLLGGMFLGLAASSYSTTGVPGYGSQADDTHYFYEISLDLDLLFQAGWKGDAFDIHWTENCANDNILLLVDPEDVPEPGSLALVGIGMIGLLGGGGLRFRRRSLRQEHFQQTV